tara:strand:- start:1035 stop:1841 length:807 start_codon:yes stop_codon:yes gene_type:complete
MKLNHNKKRNTIFIYEMLVKELSKASMHGITEKKQQILSIIKEAFSKEKLLRSELDIYKSFQEIEGLKKTTVEKMIAESKKRFSALDRKRVFDEQTVVISKINKALGASVWNTFITEFKKMATVNQILSENLAPKSQVLLEEKFLDNFLDAKKDKKPFPNVNNLAVKNFVQKFNEEYSSSLNENQKKLLNKYISSHQDRGIELKAYLYEEIDRIRDQLASSVGRQDEAVVKKVKKIIEKIDDYNKRQIDRSLITEVMKIQSLVEEINK